MKLIRTRGLGSQAAAETLAALERRGGAALDAVLPAVKRIVANVRRRGDRALLAYAAEFDGLSGPGEMCIRDSSRRKGESGAPRMACGVARNHSPPAHGLGARKGFDSAGDLHVVWIQMQSFRHHGHHHHHGTSMPADCHGLK